jgi:DNA polymerase
MLVPVYDIKNCGPRHRFSANGKLVHNSDKLNLQNLPSRGKDAGKLKRAIMAPPGHVIIDCDSSQIEARVLAWWAGQDDLVEVFEKNNAEIAAGVKKNDFQYDPYKLMASRIYNKPTTDITDSERFIGKTTILGCIAEGTLVLSDFGWKPIEKISLRDKLWDGEEWVCHQGLVTKGYKKTVNVCGSWLTPDHKILCGNQWRETQYVVADESTLSLALDTGVENLPLQGMSKGYGAGLQHSLLNATAVPQSTPLTSITLETLRAHDVTYVLRRLVHALASCIGGTATLLRMTPTGNGCLTEYPVAYPGATQGRVRHISTMADAVLRCMNRGAKIVEHFYATSSAYLTGMTPNVISTVLITPRDTNPAIYGLPQRQKTRKTSERSAFCSRNLMTYDLAYSGPRNRFTIATDAGPLIVHNCGYGMGAVRFQEQLKTFGVDTPIEECRRIISTYRESNPMVVTLWKQAQYALTALSQGSSTAFGREGVLELVPAELGVRLPNGLLLRYDGLSAHQEEKGVQYKYKTRRGMVKIYGGKVVENFTQALARIVVGEQLLKIAKRYRVVLTVHDAVACVAPEQEAEEAVKYVEECMRTVPTWAKGLPINCESGVGKSYGEC